MSDEELEQVAGGTFTPNAYSKEIYAVLGIKVISHFFAKDEFWWNGQEIGHNNANDLVFFKRQTSEDPKSVEEAVKFRKEYNSKQKKDPFDPYNVFPY